MLKNTNFFSLQYSEEVLAVFKSYKLDDTQASRKKMEELKTGGEHVYFAKFLTSEKVSSSSTTCGDVLNMRSLLMLSRTTF